MLPLLSKIARKLGLVTFYMVIVREKKDGSIRIREESFPQNDLVDVEIHVSIPQYTTEKEFV